MKNRIIKVLSLILFGGLLGLPAAAGAVASYEVKAEDVVTTFGINDFKGKGISGDGDKVSVTKNTVTVSTNYGFGHTDEFRIYAKNDNKLKISTSVGKIDKIEFTFNQAGGLDTSYTNVNNAEWSAKPTSQVKITEIKVTTTTDGATVDAISLDYSGAVTSYTRGDALSVNNVKVSANLSSGSSVNVTDKCTFSPANGTALDTVGSQIVTVTYPSDASIPSTSGEALTATYSVTVTEGETPMVFTKVTKTSDLAVGDSVILVAETALKASTNTLSADSTAYKHYLTTGNVIITGSEAKYTSESGVKPFTLVSGLVSNTFAFKTESNKYLAPYSVSKDGLILETSVTKKASYTINLEAGTNRFKSNIDGAASDSHIYLKYNVGTIRSYKSSSAVEELSIYKYSSGIEKVSVDKAAATVLEGNSINVTATAEGFTPSSYSWSVSDSSKLQITAGENSNIVTVKGLAEGSSNLTVKCDDNDSLTATCVVTINPKKSVVLEEGDYFVINYGNNHELASNLSDNTVIDYTSTSNLWTFALNGIDGDTYTISNGSKYLIHDPSKTKSAIALTDDDSTYWTISKTSDYYTLSYSESGNQLSCNPSASTGTWFAYATPTSDQAKIRLVKQADYVDFEIAHEPQYKTYYVGDDFRTTGLKVNAIFEGGAKSEITASIVWDKISAGTQATGKVTIGGVERTITVDGLTIYAPKTLSATGVKSTYYIGQKVSKDTLSVTVEFEAPGVAETKSKILKADEYIVSPETIESTTTSITISYAADATIKKEFAISTVENHFVAANYVGTGDVITIGTLGYTPTEITGGEEFTYEDGKFGHDSFGYMPYGNQKFEVTKVGNYYSLKNIENGKYLRGDASSFKDYVSSKENEIYKDKNNKYTFDMDVTFSTGVVTMHMMTDSNPNLEDDMAIWGYDDTYISGYSYLSENKFTFERCNESFEVVETVNVLVDWRVDGGAFVYSLPGDVPDPVNDEALWSLHYDDEFECWDMICKQFDAGEDSPKCYYNPDAAGKFGFYKESTAAGYTSIMIFRDNTKALPTSLTDLAVSFQEGMNEVQVGEEFPWTSALIVTARYAGGAFSNVPVGGYQVVLPDTSKVGQAKGKVIYGQEGNTVEREFTITVTGKSQAFVIKGAQNPLNVGKTCQLRVEPEPAEGEPIKWETSNASLATISDTGLVTGVGPGKVTLTATSYDGKYSDSVDITIFQPCESVTLNSHSESLNVGGVFQLSATVNPDNASNKTVSYSSDNESIVSVDSKTGLVTAIGTGTAIVTVTTQNGNKTDTCSFTVNPKPAVHVTGISLSETSKTMQIGDEFTLTATVLPEDADNKSVTWTSSSTSVATVENGKVKAIESGETTITAKTVDGGFTATCKVTVDAKPVVHVTGVKLSETSKEVEVGKEFTLTATVTPENAENKNVTWSSSNTSVATVVNGVVKGLKAGEATITVTTVDGGFTATCKVTVKEKGQDPIHVTSVGLSKTESSLVVGESETLTAIIMPENADNKAVTWSSSNANVAIVDANGKVTAIAEGTATITATTVDGNKTAICNYVITKKAEPQPEPKKDNSDTIAVAAIGGTIGAAGIGCGVGIPLGVRRKHKKLGK